MKGTWKENLYSASFAILAVFAVAQTLANHVNILVPIYGSAASRLHLENVLRVSTILAITTPSKIAIRVAGLCSAAAPLMLVLPTLTHWIAAYSARFRHPVWGACSTHVTTWLPISYIFIVTVLVHANRSLAVFMGSAKTSRSSLSLTSRFLSVSFWTILFPRIRRLPLFSSEHSCTGTGITALLVAIEAFKTFLMAGSDAQRARKATLKTVFPLYLATLILQALLPSFHHPTLPHPLTQQYIHPTFPLRVLASTQSTTGIVVVGDILPQADTELHSLRYLRVAHSLVGGVFIEDRIVTIDGQPLAFDRQGYALGDSIFSAFALQEAVRLFYRPEHDQVTGRQRKALIIGLGAGIAAGAFAKHNMTMTVVEIDPAVFDAASRFFGMPDLGPGNVFLEDARSWVQKRRAFIQGSTGAYRDEARYDIVVHDCFSGGGAPSHIFTVEFWEELKVVMEPDGVLAVNFVSKLGSDQSRAVFLTLTKVFSQCRAFHDSLDKRGEELFKDMRDIVFFCSPSHAPLQLRAATEADHLNSHVRRIILSALETLELDPSWVTGDMSHVTDVSPWILTDTHNPLGKWQESQAVGYWKMMREMLPDVIWETY